MLLDDIEGDDVPSTPRTINNDILSLRGKIETVPSKPKHSSPLTRPVTSL